MQNFGGKQAKNPVAEESQYKHIKRKWSSVFKDLLRNQLSEVVRMSQWREIRLRRWLGIRLILLLGKKTGGENSRSRNTSKESIWLLPPRKDIPQLRNDSGLEQTGGRGMKKGEWTRRCRVKGRLNTMVHLHICRNDPIERGKVMRQKQEETNKDSKRLRT